VADLNRREKLILATLLGAGVLARPRPQEPMRKSEQAALHFQRLVAGARSPTPWSLRRCVCARRWSRRDELDHASCRDVPEHLLLAGIVVMLAVDILSARPRSHLPVARRR